MHTVRPHVTVNSTVFCTLLLKGCKSFVFYCIMECLLSLSEEGDLGLANPNNTPSCSPVGVGDRCPVGDLSPVGDCCPVGDFCPVGDRCPLGVGDFCPVMESLFFGVGDRTAVSLGWSAWTGSGPGDWARGIGKCNH